MILRELLALFYGNELSSGLALASWLLWTALGSRLAGRGGGRIQKGPSALYIGLTLLALLLPLTLLSIRASRILWSIPPGEAVQLPLMLTIAFSTTSLFCFMSGCVFALAWSLQTRSTDGRDPPPIGVYVGEALGAAAGGLIFYFFLLPRSTVLDAALMVSLAVLAAEASLLVWGRSAAASRSAFLLTLAGLLASSAALAWSVPLERLSRSLQWGTDLVAVRDTPFHNAALLKRGGQVSFFANGLWLFSYPDPQTVEFAAHIPLLEHPSPRSVLMIGGGAAGLAGEILKHPTVAELDYVEADPEVIGLAKQFLPREAVSPLSDGRVRVLNADAGSYVRESKRRYDVVSLNTGDPMNAETNRFYTAEFFQRVRKLLEPGGILSFAVSSSPNIIGPAQAGLLQSVYITLRSVFPSILVFPGDTARFLASNERGVLTDDPETLIRRMEERRLHLEYIRESYLLDYMNPMQMEYMAKILSSGSSSTPNTDFHPICYFNNLVVWGAQLHPVLAKSLRSAAVVTPLSFWIALGLVACLAPLTMRACGCTTGAALNLNAALAGGSLMSLEIVLLLGFQVLEGYIYTELALIVSLFMAGAASGAALRNVRPFRNAPPLRALIVIQAALSAYLIGVWQILLLLQSNPRILLPVQGSAAPVFATLALAGGLIGGLHFALAVSSSSEAWANSSGTAAVLYSWDLMGAAGGALAASLFLLPVYGLTTTLCAVAFANLGGLITLVRR